MEKQDSLERTQQNRSVIELGTTAIEDFVAICSENIGREVLMGRESLPPGTHDRLRNGAIAGQNLLPNGEVKPTKGVPLSEHPLVVAGRQRRIAKH